MILDKIEEHFNKTLENEVHSLRSRSEKLVGACLGHPLDNMEYLEKLLNILFTLITSQYAEMILD